MPVRPRLRYFMATTEKLRTDGQARRKRVDAERNLNALLASAKAVFATSGVDAPAKEITDAAGLGVGTLYRHFPRRADLIVAVLHQEIDACADAATALRAQHTPYEALRLWVHRYVDLIGTKRGLAEALHSGDTTFAGLHAYVAERLEPVVAALLADAVAADEIAAKVPPQNGHNPHRGPTPGTGLRPGPPCGNAGSPPPGPASRAQGVRFTVWVEHRAEERCKLVRQLRVSRLSPCPGTDRGPQASGCSVRLAGRRVRTPRCPGPWHGGESIADVVPGGWS
jgi:AcrR family transcriptional regulator